MCVGWGEVTERRTSVRAALAWLAAYLGMMRQMARIPPGSAVYVGGLIDDKLRSLKRDDIRRLTLGPPDIQEPKPSAVSELMRRISADAHRFSTKGYAWWCDGVQYGWEDLLDEKFCRTQPQVLQAQYERTNGSKITREKADRGETTTRHLHSRFAPVRVGCPALADRPCRGFVRLTRSANFRTCAGFQTARSS